MICAERSIVDSGVESLDIMYIRAHIDSMNGTTDSGRHSAKNLSRYRRIIGASVVNLFVVVCLCDEISFFLANVE